MEPFEQLATSLRERLIERARVSADGTPVEDQVRELVAIEAAPLPEPERARLAERVLRLATGLGPLEPLLADPAVDEVMVNGGGGVYVERHGRLEHDERGLLRPCRADARDRADPRAARPPRRRGVAALRRAAARRLARERRDPAALGRRARA